VTATRNAQNSPGIAKSLAYPKKGEWHQGSNENKERFGLCGACPTSISTTRGSPVDIRKVWAELSVGKKGVGLGCLRSHCGNRIVPVVSYLTGKTVNLTRHDSRIDGGYLLPLQGSSKRIRVILDVTKQGEYQYVFRNKFIKNTSIWFGFRVATIWPYVFRKDDSNYLDYAL
jgi:hypothetical protein